MPIVRSYMCDECGHHVEVTLDMDQADAPPPECDRCLAHMQQDFKPVAIGGSNRAKAEKLAEDILEKDYHVADIQRDPRLESTPKTRYRDQTPANKSTWGAAQGVLEGAMREGRAIRQKYGDGLDILRTNLKNGTEPDLLEISKRRAMRVW